MSDRAAFVSGGSSGIGLALARALLEDGVALTLVARREAKLLAAAEELGELGEVQPFAADFRSDEQVEAAADAHRTRFGRLDVLVNNAGVAIGAPLERTSSKAVELALAVNLRSTITCTRSLVDLLVASAPSHVINMSSFTGVHGQAWMTAYSASKAGVNGFTDAFRAEYADRGVKATAICPAFVDTAMSDAVRDLVDSGELIQVADVVALVMAILRLSPNCSVPTVTLQPLSGQLQGWDEAVRSRGGAESPANGGTR